MPYAASNIAWWAHIGGFIAGTVLLLWLEQSNRPAVRYNGGPWER
jgi:membrane associated rhomboid family serine protease